MRRLVYITLALVWFCLPGKSQDLQPFGYYLDALRFSQTSLGGTARTQSMGGVQVALGGEMSAALSNPAGLGMYNRSDLNISPLVSLQNASGDYLGQTTNTNSSQFSIAHAGIALQSNPEYESNFLSGTFAITLTRINDFTGSYMISGTNNNTSIIDAYIDQANGATTDQFGGNDLPSLAYFNYLLGPRNILDPSEPDDMYFTDVIGVPEQEDRYQTTGRQNQWSIAYGGNFSDKVYFGLALGITSLKYDLQRTYTESFTEDPLFYTTSIETLKITGTGVNGTLGLLFRPVDNIRVGFSFITPTLYGIEDTYDAVMESEWNNYLYLDPIDGDTLLTYTYAETDFLQSNYSLSTPFKLNGGLSYFFGKYGFLSIDVSYTDHTRSKLSTDDFSMADDNQVIKEVATSTLDLRIGGEVRINAFMLRAGYQHRPAAYQSDEAIYQGGNSFTTGLGFRKRAFYSDLAVIYQYSKQEYAPYFLHDQTPVSNISNSNTRIMLTLGSNF